jgi:hypothetical protein
MMITIPDRSTTTELSVRLPARLHLDGKLVDVLKRRLDIVETDEKVDEEELVALKQILAQEALDIDELSVGVVTGSPTDDLLPGRVLLSLPGVSVEVDASDLTRALKPFIRRFYR